MLSKIDFSHIDTIRSDAATLKFDIFKPFFWSLDLIPRQAQGIAALPF
jgi:hypothetical protein